MEMTTNWSFGLVVAYLLPGFIALAGLALLVPPVAHWLVLPGAEASAGIAPPVYVVLTATALGMTLSSVRWIILDHLHFWTGVIAPAWDMDRLDERLGAFTYFVENHYKHYLFYGNTLIAVIWTYGVNRWMGTSRLLGLGTDFGVLLLSAALFAGSCDALAKYCARTNRLLSPVAKKDSAGDAMTNGCHQDQGGGKMTNKQDDKPQVKQVVTKIEPVKEKAIKEKQ